jgi:CBS domain-containing protein
MTAVREDRDQITVADVMTARPHMTEATAPLSEILHRMLALGHREIVVTVGDRPLGVLTERLLTPMLQPRLGRWPPQYAVDLLPTKTSNLLEGIALATAAAVMTREGMEALPVVDSHGVLVGVLSHRHVVGHLAQQALP